MSIITTNPRIKPAYLHTESLEVYINDVTHQLLNTYVAYVSARLDRNIQQATRDRKRNEANLKEDLKR